MKLKKIKIKKTVKLSYHYELTKLGSHFVGFALLLMLS